MYRIIGNGVKIHWASRKDVAEKVKSNLESRYSYCNAGIEFVKEKNKHFLFLSEFANQQDISFRFVIDKTLTIEVKTKNWNTFLHTASKDIYSSRDFANKYNKQFYKLHDSTHILCLSVEQRNELLYQIDNNRLRYTAICENLTRNVA